MLSKLSYFPEMSRVALGSGAGGHVYLEQEHIDGKTFYKAVKTINNGYRSEIRLMEFLKTLRKPNLIHIKEGKDDHEIEMDLIPGGCLTDFFCAGVPEFDATCKLRIAYQVADALLELHKANFVHRDVKPDNVLIDENFNAVLADLGFGRSFPVGEEPTYVVGTFVYSPPEVQTKADFDKFLADHGMAGSATMDQLHQLEVIDVYQFGMLLYSMFAEKVPFGEDLDPLGSSNEWIKQKILDGCRPDWPDDMATSFKGVRSDVLEAIYHGCTQQRVEYRISMEDVIQMLREAFEDQSVLEDCDRWLDTPLEQQSRHGTMEKVLSCAERGFPGASDILSKISQL